MYPAHRPTATPVDALRTIVRHYRLWLPASLLGGLVALVHLLVTPGVWQASQAMVLRNEALNSQDSPGRFRQDNEMRTAQETVLEMVRSRSVVARALTAVGPPADRMSQTTWPSPEEIADQQGSISITPPKGAEIGKTEILYLGVKDKDCERALALVAALGRELQAGLGQLRDAKAQSLIGELTRALALADSDLDDVTERLSRMEEQVGGSDLADLRMLDQTSIGDSDLRRKLTAVETEQRDAHVGQRANSELLAALAAAEQDPGALLAAPNRLLESQPALKRLKDGLVDAQLRTAQLLGFMSEAHPQVRVARAAEQEISQHIHHEVAIARRGVEIEQRLVAGRIELLEQQLSETRGRLDRLAAMRAEYSNLSNAFKHQNSLVEKARRDLADARGSQAGAHAASLVNLIDLPSTGSRPIGPGRSITLLAGLAGGLLLGLGLVFLTADFSPVPSPASRQTNSRGLEPPAADRPATEFRKLSVSQALLRVVPRDR